MAERLSVQDIKKIFTGGKMNLEAHKAEIDSLNVFPVPDGDTGTNMFLTMMSTVKELEVEQSENLYDVCRAFARGALKGARGNSGVILSQILKGMSEVIGDAKVVNARTFARALKHGSSVAYDVVTHPKEGTILTVIRLVGDYAVKIATRKNTFEEFFPLILAKGAEVLADTPNLLPVLKKAGVVDAGGKGLLTILEGMYYAIIGKEIVVEVPSETAAATKKTELKADVHNLDEITFAYCTEFFIINLKKRTTVSDIDKLRDRLNQIGDCIIVVGDLTLVKVHVHTNNPDKALGYALQLGELDKPKIENMLEQSREYKRALEDSGTVKDVAMVSICSGEGLAEIFTSLGVDKVLEGGQTMNPSVSDIVEVVNAVRAENVFIFPNNGNIILAAEQAVELVQTKLVVIATKTVPEGIAAAMNFNSELSIEENTRNMQKAAEEVRSGQVTHSVKDTEIDGFKLHIGDIIGLTGGKIVTKGDNLNEVTKELIASMTDDGTSSITLYYGSEVSDEEAEALTEKIREEYDFYDVDAYNGGQQHYYYLISVQ